MAYNVIGLIFSLPTNQRAEYILTTMNEELLAASVWLAVRRLVFATDQCSANPSLQCSSPPSYFNNTGGISKGIITSILPLRKADRLQVQKRTGCQSVSLYCATNIISQLMFAFTGINRFISMESLWRQFKNLKTTRDVYLCLDLSIHGNHTSIQSIW